MRFLRFTFLSILFTVGVLGCGDETDCQERSHATGCTIGKMVFSETDFEILFNYDDKNRLISLLRNDEKRGFYIEYAKNDKLKKVTLFSDEQFGRIYTYEYFASRIEITVMDPFEQNLVTDYIIIRKNSCNQIVKYENYDRDRSLLTETAFEWGDGNIMSYTINLNPSGCEKTTYTYDDNSNPFYFLSEIVLNPFLSTSNNIIGGEGQCFTGATPEIQYLNNGYPESINPFLLHYIFAAGKDAHIVYKECL